jgi:hypothetical protein
MLFGWGAVSFANEKQLGTIFSPSSPLPAGSQLCSLLS